MIIDLPIIFNGDMVQATLNGFKSNTRRCINWHKMFKKAGCTKGRLAFSTLLNQWALYDTDTDIDLIETTCPYGKVGDRLYVRENWRTFEHFNHLKPSELDLYTAIFYESGRKWNKAVDIGTEVGKLRPSIFIPKWASRIWLEITGIRVEQLQRISKHDAIEEGIETAGLRWRRYGQEEHPCLTPIGSFQSLWDSINGKTEGRDWLSNPYVWVISFKVINNG